VLLVSLSCSYQVVGPESELEAIVPLFVVQVQHWDLACRWRYSGSEQLGHCTVVAVVVVGCMPPAAAPEFVEYHPAL
jgi:hypothetical protein